MAMREKLRSCGMLLFVAMSWPTSARASKLSGVRSQARVTCKVGSLLEILSVRDGEISSWASWENRVEAVCEQGFVNMLLGEHGGPVTHDGPVHGGGIGDDVRRVAGDDLDASKHDALGEGLP
eukprot:5213551-Pyramimonas_sp.AAC.1